MMARLLYIGLAAAAIVAPLAASCQTPSADSTLRAGVRVRAVRVRGSDVTGALVSIDDRGVVIRSPSGRSDTLPTATVGELWRSRGAGLCSPNRRVGCVIAGLVIGTAGGAGTGAAIGRAAARRDRANNNCHDGICEIHKLEGLIFGGVVGGLTGLFIGASVGGEHWERLASPVPRVGFVPARGGGFTLAWSRSF